MYGFIVTTIIKGLSNLETVKNNKELRIDSRNAILEIDKHGTTKDRKSG
jgi:hypothetical protein